MRTEDGEIIQECLNGKPQAFGILVDKYREGVYAFSYAELRDFQDAQDVTQEVFLQAYRKLRSLRNRESFAFWLYRIAYRYCVQCIRDRARRVDRDFIEDQDPGVVDAPSLDSHRESQLDASVREALDMLPDAYREVLLLHYFGGLTIKDIAKAVGASPAAIGMRLSRARAQLKEEMIAMMDTAFEGHRLPMGFTFRIVEVVKRIKINPMPRVSGLPWGLSLAVGVIVTVLSLNPHMSIPNDMAIPTGTPLPVESKVLRTGEIPADILKTSEISVIASKQGDGDGGKPQHDPQKALMLAPQAEGGTWTKRADMPTPRWALCASVVDGVIYAMGGGQGFNDVLEVVEAYNPTTDTWTRKANIPTPRSWFNTAVVDGKIYAIGGDTPGSNPGSSVVEEYDQVTDTWRRRANMPTARGGMATTVVDGKIYVIGGYTGAGAVSTVEVYDPATDTWTKKANMPTARWLPVFPPTADDIIYVISGESANGTPSYAVEVYDPATDTWKKKADIPQWLGCSAGAAVLDGRIYAGHMSYDLTTGTLRKEPAAPTPRKNVAVAAVNGSFYVIGGKRDNNSPSLATVEQFTPDQSTAASPQGKLPTKWGEVK